MKKILVTGKNGQLGRCIMDAAPLFPKLDILFTTFEMLDIEDRSSVSEIFQKNTFDYCINTAAYTHVEKAESEAKKAFRINAEAVKNLASVCYQNNTVLIHISTDYVFDGTKEEPYNEKDKTNPINVYGRSKLKGEYYIKEICDQYFIIRSSWLYSQYGKNFFMTILNLAKKNKPFSITTEQTGTPTNANDLALAILKIIESGNNKYGVYNYSNEGEANWYDFAKAILEYSPQLSSTNLVQIEQYRTFAARPKYSVLNNDKFCKTFSTKTINWKKSLQILVNRRALNT